MDCIALGILQARILKWVAFPSPEDLPNPGIEPRSPALHVDSLPAEPLSFTFIEKVFGEMHFTLITSFNEAYSF